MLDLLAAVVIDVAGLFSPNCKEDTRRQLAHARRGEKQTQERYTALEAQIDTAMDLTIYETDRILLELDPKCLNRNRRRYGLPPVKAV